MGVFSPMFRCDVLLNFTAQNIDVVSRINARALQSFYTLARSHRPFRLASFEGLKFNQSQKNGVDRQDVFNRSTIDEEFFPMRLVTEYIGISHNGTLCYKGRYFEHIY